MRSIAVFILSFTLIFLCSFERNVKTQSVILPSVASIDHLDRSASFSFSIISDNQGLDPLEDIRMARMSKWVAESGDKFVVGLGDHVRKNDDNDFVSYLIRDEWWNKNFYPIVGDAENDYFGNSQADWGKGGKLFKATNMSKRENLDIRPNDCEYYAKIEANGYTIHLIALHYPDEPADPEIGFPKDSRNYLVNTVKSIKKGPKDIIITGAHSRYGFWIDYLSDEQKKIVYDKCDLILSGTTHYFERREIKERGDQGPLILNAGSVTNAKFGAPNGYIQVHILENPFAIVTQFINTDMPFRTLQNAPFAYIKYGKGGTYPLDLQTPLM